MNLGENMKRINYLNNKDILAEIAKSKNTFCSYTDGEYAVYDIILPSLDKVNIRTIEEAKRKQAQMIENIILGVLVVFFLGAVGAILYLILSVD